MHWVAAPLVIDAKGTAVGLVEYRDTSEMGVVGMLNVVLKLGDEAKLD